MVSASSLLEQALQLDEAARAELADRLYESVMEVSPEWEAAWAIEIEHREAEHLAGRDPDIPWENVREALFATIRNESQPK